MIYNHTIRCWPEEDEFPFESGSLPLSPMAYSLQFWIYRQISVENVCQGKGLPSDRKGKHHQEQALFWFSDFRCILEKRV